jgi:universal stress protein E
MTFKSILVDIDASASDHPALEQGIDLARRCGARVKIVDVVEEVPGIARRYFPSRLESELVAHHRESLDGLEKEFQNSGVEVSTAVLRGRAVTALVKEVIAAGHDLLARSHARDLSARGSAFGSIDRGLFRKCPCPVWVVGPGEHTRPRRILAAVHSNPESDEEQDLNRRIVEHALELADLEHGTITIAQAWTPFGLQVLAPRLSEEDVAEFVREARRAIKDDLDALVKSLGDRAAKATVKLVKGEPGVAIARLVKTDDIDLVVMGTMARSGVVGLVVGNTAERMLDGLRCSVFTLKPRGFVSPLAS